MTTSSTGPDEEKLYPYHFHIVPALSHVAQGIANFLSFHAFGWQRVVIITQDQKDYKKVSRAVLVVQYKNNNQQPSATISVISETTSQVR